MHVNALRRWTAFPSNWIWFKTNVSRETSTDLKHDKSAHSTVRETRFHSSKPQQPIPTNQPKQTSMFHVKHQPPTTNREETTLPNNQPANQPTPQCFTWNATTRSINSSLQLRRLMFHVKPKPETKIPLQQRNYLPPTNPSKYTSIRPTVSRETWKLIQRSQTWLVSVGKEDQAR